MPAATNSTFSLLFFTALPSSSFFTEAELREQAHRPVKNYGGSLACRSGNAHPPNGLDFLWKDRETKNSRRIIRLTKGTISALRVHLSRQFEEIEEICSLYQPGGLILTTEAGPLINPSNICNRSFKPLLKRAGLPPVRFHGLRHTCATLLLSKKINLNVVSEMLGRSSISITLDIYSHLLPDMQEKAVEAQRRC